MTATVNDFLTGFGVGGALKHAETPQTVQDLMDAMSQDQKDFVALIVGAALDDGDLDEVSVQRYISLPDIQKHLIDFIVGNITAEGMKHSDMADDLDDFLAHYGVKGMKWGVIRDSINAPGSLSRSSANTSAGRKSARAAVESGNATAKQAHLAALKSTGHRAINALSGDKTFWRRMAITAGVSTAVVAAPVTAAYFLPAGALSAIGASSAGAALAGNLATSSFLNYSAAQIGQIALSNAGVFGGLGTYAVAGATNIVGNTARAVAGNSLVNRSYAKVGNTLRNRQKSGRQRVVSALSAVAGTRAKDLRHSDLDFDEIKHALESGSGGAVKKDAPKGDGKGGGRKFDESKVKRDGSGQFARTASKKPDSTDIGRTPEQLDAEWQSKLDDNDKIKKAVWGDEKMMRNIINFRRDYYKRTGIDPGNTGGSKKPASVEARKALITYSTKEINRVLSTSPAAVSPSGTKRVQVRLNPSGEGVTYVLVDNVVKHDSMTAQDFIDNFSFKNLSHGLSLEQIMVLLGIEGELDLENED